MVPAGIKAEVAFMVEGRLGARVLAAFLADLEDGAFVLDCGEADLSRARVLVARYGDLPLGYADASVIACAERNGDRILSYDLHHFPVVARESAIRLVGIEAE